MAKSHVSAPKSVYVDVGKLLSFSDRIVGLPEKPPNYDEMAEGIERKNKYLKTATNGDDPPTITAWCSEGKFSNSLLRRARVKRIQLGSLEAVVAGLQSLGRFQPALHADEFIVSKAEFEVLLKKYEATRLKKTSAKKVANDSDQLLNPTEVSDFEKYSVLVTSSTIESLHGASIMEFPVYVLHLSQCESEFVQSDPAAFCGQSSQLDFFQLPKSSDANAPPMIDEMDVTSPTESSNDSPAVTPFAKDLADNDDPWYRNKILHIAIAACFAFGFIWVLAGAIRRTSDPTEPLVPGKKFVTLIFSNNSEYRDYDGNYARFASAKDFLESAPIQSIEEDKDFFLTEHSELLAPLKRRAAAAGEDGRFSVYLNENLTEGVSSVIPSSIRATIEGDGELILVVVRQGGFDFPESRGFIVLGSSNEDSKSPVFSVPRFIVNNKNNEHPSSLSFAALLYQPGRAPVVDKIDIELIKDD